MKFHWGSLAIGVALGMFGVPMLQQLVAKSKSSSSSSKAS